MTEQEIEQDRNCHYDVQRLNSVVSRKYLYTSNAVILRVPRGESRRPEDRNPEARNGRRVCDFLGSVSVSISRSLSLPFQIPLPVQGEGKRRGGCDFFATAVTRG